MREALPGQALDRLRQVSSPIARANDGRDFHLSTVEMRSQGEDCDAGVETDERGDFISNRKWYDSREARAMMVSVGLANPPVGKTELVYDPRARLLILSDSVS